MKTKNIEKPLKYGETREVDNSLVQDEQNTLIDLFDYKKGDILDINLLEKNYFKPILVVNCEDYLDIEYRFKLDEIIYTREQAYEILNKLK